MMLISKYSRQLAVFYFSLLVACFTCLGTGLIPSWGKWYSIGVPYRQQTDAMLQGHLRLSESPVDAKIDLAWGRNGVQQVWGLGVPVWRLPFELLARLFGQSAFPDRIALLAAFTLFNYVVLRALCFSDSTAHDFSSLGRSPLEFMAALVIVLFPPMLTFLKGEFLVYEEAVVYGYFFAVGLFVGLVALVRRPVLSRYCLVCLLAGAAGFFRPTMLGYGLATFMAAFLFSRCLRWRWRTSILGLMFFAAGNLVLLGTNWLRFGVPWEFGYGVQLNTFYELKFDVPFQHEPLWSAARELFGSLFFTTDLNVFDWYQTGLVRWQSSTPRWRQFYHTTFDVTYLVAVTLCWSVMVVQSFRRPRSVRTLFANVHLMAGLWSLICVIPLAVFYLRSVVMSSRYILDFAPAIAVACAGLVWSVRASLAHSKKPYLKYFVVLTLCGWWFLQIQNARRSIGPTKILSQEEMQEVLKDRESFRPIPAFYTAEDKPDKCGIPLNRRGWKGVHGETGAMVVLFVENPGEITLEVAPVPDVKVAEEDYWRIRVKLGREELTLKTIATGEAGSKILTFSASTHEEYRQGIQVLFLGFGRPEDFSLPKSSFLLRSVHWTKNDSPSTQLRIETSAK